MRRYGKDGNLSPNFPYAAFELLRSENSTFSSVFGYTYARPYNVIQSGHAESVPGLFVTGNYFSGLGVPPAAGRLVMMGMCYRFHPALQRLRTRVKAGEIGRVLGGQLWVGQYLPDWHPWADYRAEYSARRALGGGVLLDCIHAFDTARWLFGEFVEVTGMLGRVSDLAIDTEDVVAAVLRRADGVLVEVHLDYLQREPANRVEIIGSEGTLRWDFHARQLHTYRVGIECASEATIPVEPDVMYQAELREFLACVTQGRAAVVDGYEGARTLTLTMAVRTAAHTARHVRLDTGVADVTATDGAPLQS